MGKATKVRDHDEVEHRDGEAGHGGKRPVLVDVKNRRKLEFGEGAQRNANHCTICWLHHRKHISDLQHQAAERLQDDHVLAGLTCFPSSLAALAAGGGRGGGGAAEIVQSKIDASQRRADALNAVGTSGRFLLEQIALEDKTAKETAAILRVDKQAVVPSLCVALDSLVVHYKLSITGDDRGRIRAIHPFDGGV